jgi:hypothetical protein
VPTRPDDVAWLASVLKREPSMSAGIVTAICTLAALLGLDWPPAVVAPVLAAVTLGLSVLVRQRVIPSAGIPSGGGGKHEKQP